MVFLTNKCSVYAHWMSISVILRFGNNDKIELGQGLYKKQMYKTCNESVKYFLCYNAKTFTEEQTFASQNKGFANSLIQILSWS